MVVWLGDWLVGRLVSRSSHAESLGFSGLGFEMSVSEIGGWVAWLVSKNSDTTLKVKQIPVDYVIQFKSHE